MLEKIYNLFAQYEFTNLAISQEADSKRSVYIEAKNYISNRGFIKNPVLCRIEIIKSGDPDEIKPYRLNCFESSYCILGGGCGFYGDSEILEAAEKELKRYKFRKKVV